MNYLAQLTEEEIQYICSIIPLHESILYFKQHPKDFAKIKPGFRPTSLKNQEQVSALLFRSRNQYFVSAFIEKRISRWLDEIKKSVAQKIADGDNKESALFKTLPFCFFVDKIGLYFKLVGEEYSEENVTLLSAGIKIIRDLDDKHKKLETLNEDNIFDIEHLESELERSKIELNNMGKELEDRLAEIKVLKRISVELEELKINMQTNEQVIADLKNKALAHENYIQQLNSELAAAQDDRQLLETQIREELEKRQAVKIAQQETAHKPKRPKDIDDFQDYLAYNLESIGIAPDAKYFPLLKEHLSEILFQGRPIIIGRNVGVTLMKCVANALVGSTEVASLVFTADLSEQSINEFLSTDQRIVVLDNFIGNFNETILLTICSQHKDKIIFLTVAYDRTLCYVPEEFIKYCHYLNLSRIKPLTLNPDLTEDPSVIDEIEFSHNQEDTYDLSRWSQETKKILAEFGIGSVLTVHKSFLVSDEQSLCRLLAFDILPYCVDVLQLAPYNTSEKFVKYAGGRCSYKDLFKEWFA